MEGGIQASGNRWRFAGKEEQKAGITLDLNQSQIDAIIQSPIGRDNLMARISKFIEKILR